MGVHVRSPVGCLVAFCGWLNLVGSVFPLTSLALARAEEKRYGFAHKYLVFVPLVLAA